MKNTQTFPLVMLPTEKASKVVLQNKWLYNSSDIKYFEETKQHFESQHIYIVSDEEIKEGDWFYRNPAKCVYKANNNISSELKSNSYYGIIYRKIIATTDKSLNLPLIHDSFLPPFIKAYNEGKQITEVDLEIDNHIPDTDGDLGTPLTRKDNTVIILEVKKYSKQDMEEAFQAGYSAGSDDSEGSIQVMNFTNWLKKYNS